MKNEDNGGRKDKNIMCYSVQEYHKVIIDMLKEIDDDKFLRSIAIILRTYIEKRGH